MASTSFSILPIEDDALLTSLSTVAKELGGETDVHCSVSVFDSGGSPISGPYASILKNPAIKRIREVNSTAIRSVSLSGPANSGSVSVTRKDGYDTCNINTADGAPHPFAVGLSLVVRESLKSYDRVPSLDKRLGPELAEFYRTREKAVLSLEALNEKVLRQSQQYRDECDARTRQDQDKLRDEYRDKEKELKESFEVKEGNLRAREAKLAEQISVLDDRSNTHARRQLRSELKGILAQRNTAFNLTSATTRKRVPIHALFIAMMIAAGTAVATSFWNLTHLGQSEATQIYATVRVAISLSLLGCAIFFYIRWNDAWARLHAEEEFRLKRMELDVDRASWVVETALEWKEARGGAIPPELLDRLTRNLFQEADKHEVARHPTEDVLRLLLGASTSLRLPLPNGGELTLDSKGLRKLREETTER